MTHSLYLIRESHPQQWTPKCVISDTEANAQLTRCVCVCVYIYRLFSTLVSQPPTCGGGKPPAPAGHTGSMVSFLGVLHWQSGEGWRRFHFGPASISIRAGFTRGISHSVVMLLHGKSLPVGENKLIWLNKTAQITVWVKSFLKFGKSTHSMGSSTMQRVPKPGLSNSTSPKYLIWGSMGRSLLQRTIGQYIYMETFVYTLI